MILLHYGQNFFEPQNLVFHIEGFGNRTNYRDLGKSLNECQGLVEYNEGVLGRAKRQFSGMPCSLVGSPDMIVSLNHRIGSKKAYYCRNLPLDLKVGKHFNQHKTLHDLEFLATWKNDAVMAEEACRSIAAIIEGVNKSNHVLFHCDAGRDRTGAVAALLGGLVLEETAERAKVVEALDCDYQKSQNLTSSYKPRIRNFLKEVYKENASIKTFLEAYCPTIASSDIQQFRRIFAKRD